ncbi:MAG: 3-hydroxyacyl-CoA dehydrogenase family protein [Streptosporangiales bacterium]|nr:3-hydroxyacyl-CoA dehydrogenase family protein [Streptosporangiales bacterium]
MAREFRKVGVVGLGTMGAGIAEVLASHGVEVVAIDLSDEALARGRTQVRNSTDRAVARGKLTADDRAAIFDRVVFSACLDDVKDADLVIESVPENLDLKREIFAELDRICNAEAILATNTSSLSVTEISAATQRPAQVVGTHFFNPAPVMRSVEVIRTVLTDAEVVADVERLLERLDKISITVGDKAGFIANALLFGYLNQAVAMYESGYATREDIDTAMRVGCGLPMGPLTLLDLIGLDVAHDILEALFNESRVRRHAPVPLLRHMITAGLLGRKTGRGFYTYETPDSSVAVADAHTSTEEQQVAGARRVDQVGVVGADSVAQSVLVTCARAGYPVVLLPYGADTADVVLDAIEEDLDRSVASGRIDELSKKAALQRITVAAGYADLADCDMVIEAVQGSVDDKRAVFAGLDGAVKPGAVFATVTSAVPIIDLAMATSRPADVVGAHFCMPVPGGQLVEIVQTIATAPDVVSTAHAFCRRLGKQAIRCRDRAGFLVQALLFPHLGDAVKMLQARYATVDDIDAAMKYGCGYPMGPFEMLDQNGLDNALAVQTRLYEEYRDPSFAPAPLLEQLVKAGYLGRKSGRGFRDYDD